MDDKKHLHSISEKIWALGASVRAIGAVCNYALKISESDDVSALDATQALILLTATSDPEAPDPEWALVAADVITRSWGLACCHGEGAAYSAKLYKRVADGFSPSIDLVKKARCTIERALTKPSELLELSQEPNDFEIWKRSAEVMLERPNTWQQICVV